MGKRRGLAMKLNLARSIERLRRDVCSRLKRRGRKLNGRSMRDRTGGLRTGLRIEILVCMRSGIACAKRECLMVKVDCRLRSANLERRL